MKSNKKEETFNDVFSIRVVFLITFLVISLTFGGLIIYNSEGIIKVFAFTWGLAFIAIGGFFGFLFGLPNKVNENAEIYCQRIEKTNIFEISNWLTKIIIGAGLVQIKEIYVFITRVANQVSVGVHRAGNIEQTKVFINGLLIYSLLLGVVGGYIITHFFLVMESESLNNSFED